MCGKRVTWRFFVCAACEELHGKRKDDRPEWLTFLINEDAKVRYRIINRARHISYEDIENTTDSDDIRYRGRLDDVSYSIDFEALVDARTEYAGVIFSDSENIAGVILQDSDWEAVYTWSL